ncbi:MAG TPA: pirin-like C-terminal cupin domain-containing protein, partial [Polyangiaceae bacterium]|nr:pirin-like C-terminal cupin domain-containing protein [Polyangiaceae bacterium]
LEHEETEPLFEHHPQETIPQVHLERAVLDVIAGSAYGQRSPVGVLSPMFYVHAQLEAGARLPLDEEHEQRAVYVAEGSIACDGRRFDPGTLLVVRSGTRPEITSSAPARVLLLGGAKLAGERHMFWNFVSSSKERIERAKEDWKQGRFEKIPGDDIEFIPLPE